MNSEMLKEKQHQLNHRLQALEEQIKTSQQSNLEETKVPDFDRLKSRLTLIISRFSVYLKEANPEAKNQLMKLLIDSVEITTDKKVKLVRYKIDESLIPQSLKKDWGSFFYAQNSLYYLRYTEIFYRQNYHFFHLITSDESERNELNIRYILSK